MIYKHIRKGFIYIMLLNNFIIDDGWENYENYRLPGQQTYL
jgi:hypothetical protein